MALRYFAEQRCDLVIWETGLGGRLDATNIVTPKVSVITSLSYDHMAVLGNTLAFSPPLAINEDEVDEIVKRLGAAMDGVA